MSCRITIGRLLSIAESARPEMDSYLKCNPINPRIQEAIEENGVDVRRITGSVSNKSRLLGAEEHMFLEVPSDELESVSSGPVIVDGALDQFCQENYDEGIVFQNLGPRENIPCPAVLTPSNEFYDMYLYDEPW